MKHRRATVFWLAFFAASCGKQMQVALPPPTPARVGAVEVGVASWYGKPYHGRTTSNGETYDMHAMTAAHLSLPFDTLVRVTNTANGRAADLRINDRGPFVKSRLIDVSRAAAERLGMIPTGTANVRVEVIAAPGQAERASLRPAVAPQSPAEAVEAEAECDASTYGVQVASFRDPANAARTLADIAARYGAARIVRVETQAGSLHRVIVTAANGAEAQRALDQLAGEGIQGFVTRLVQPAACLSEDAS